MTEHKYTDEEVIKALELCFAPVGTSKSCKKCPFHKIVLCKIERDRAALDLLHRQKAEISALTSAVDNSTQEFLKLHDKYQEQKAEVAFWMDAAANAKKEAVKEFAERMKKECLFDRGYEILQEGTIDHLVKEFTEEKT